MDAALSWRQGYNPSLIHTQKPQSCHRELQQEGNWTDHVNPERPGAREKWQNLIQIKFVNLKIKKKKKKRITGWKIFPIFGAGANNWTDISHVFWLYTKQEAAAPVWAARLAFPQEISWDFQEALEVTNVDLPLQWLLQLLPWICAPFIHPSCRSNPLPLRMATVAAALSPPGSIHACLIHIQFQLFFSLNPSIPIRVVKGKG